MLKGNLVVAQGGGPTAVINQSLAGVVLEAAKYSEIETVYGSLHGVEGIVKGDLVVLSGLDREHLEEVSRTPGSALLSTRVKPDKEYCRKMFENMKKLNIRYFFYIGGNDSSDTVRIVSEEAQADGYELKAVHIPKTIDNDLVVNDHTPGFGSAARYVASAFAGADFDNRSLNGVYIGVVMGRHAGFLTAASALAREDENSGPHLIYLPERVFDIETFLKDVKRCYDLHGRCVIAVSEGIADAEGTPIVTRLQENVERDAHGNVQLSGTGALGDLLAKEIKAKLGISRVRADTLGYMQRSFLGVVSDVDAKEARFAGEFGVRAALSDASGRDFSVVMERIAGRCRSSNGDDVAGSTASGCRDGATLDFGNGYASGFRTVDIQEVAAKTKHMADEFINEAGNDVTPAFIDYAYPLIGTDFRKGTSLKARKVELKLI
ncbi:MAG: 6-phosphofructokinase [Bacillota bacterium]|nr:6-phosphofructokinase [Bacillota bacterium]